MNNPARLSRKRPAWPELADRFVAEKECLAAFLALESAEVVAGSKPANLFNIANRRRLCGRNMYRLWQRYGQELVDESRLEVKVLADREDSMLLLVYDAVRLCELLSRKNVGVILRKAGYADPDNLRLTLAELEYRIHGFTFPHEIGVFLGYPLKDVIGYMGWAPLPFTCQGPWKIYGDPTASLKLAECFLDCRCRIASRLSSGADPSAVFKAA